VSPGTRRGRPPAGATSTNLALSRRGCAHSIAGRLLVALARDSSPVDEAPADIESWRLAVKHLADALGVDVRWVCPPDVAEWFAYLRPSAVKVIPK
jgi:hypothetical protein